MKPLPVILPIRKPELVLPGKVSRVGWELPQHFSLDDWLACGRLLDHVEGSVQWWRGDWWAFGSDRKWGEGIDLAIKAAVNYGAVRVYGSVARAYELSRRLNNLTFGHHASAMALSVDDDDVATLKLRLQWLRRAENEEWSVAELRRQINQHKNRFSIVQGAAGSCCGSEQLHDLVRRSIRFGNIYADPPWLYDNQATRASTGNHYQGLTVDQLCDPELLPIAQLAADDAHLHLWTTNGFLFDCPRIFAAWGFEFKSTFIWVKPEIGIGNYWRNSHEFLLTAVRGNAKHFDRHDLRSWIECSRSKHSAKPEKVREYIEKASPTPRLELFARMENPGWLAWGDQIEKDLFSERVKKMKM